MVTSVVTPVWNRSDITHQFLYQNWRLYRDRPDVEFVVVNNGSEDNTALVLEQWLERMGPERLRLLANVRNNGFGPGNNQGANIAQGDNLIFLSNDVHITGDYVAPIGTFLSNHPLALGGAQMLDYDTGWNTFNGKTIPYLFGWCLFCRREVWQGIGGFDERYIPCDYEDIDLCLTATEKGYELRQVTLPLQHLYGQSAQQLAGGRQAITFRNQALFKGKWAFA